MVARRSKIRRDRLKSLVKHLIESRSLTAEQLGSRLNVSTRTIYRDIQDLAGHGIQIQGEAGVGYRLRSKAPHTLEETYDFGVRGHHAIPMMSQETPDETADSLIGHWGDDLPTYILRGELKLDGHVAGSISSNYSHPEHLKGQPVHSTPLMSLVFFAVRNHVKIRIRYGNDSQFGAERIIHPLGVACWNHIWSMVAYCEHEQGFRRFTLENIVECSTLHPTMNSKPGTVLANQRLQSQLPEARIEMIHREFE